MFGPRAPHRGHPVGHRRAPERPSQNGRQRQDVDLDVEKRLETLLLSVCWMSIFSAPRLATRIERWAGLACLRTRRAARERVGVIAPPFRGISHTARGVTSGLLSRGDTVRCFLCQLVNCQLVNGSGHDVPANCRTDVRAATRQVLRAARRACSGLGPHSKACQAVPIENGGSTPHPRRGRKQIRGEKTNNAPAFSYLRAPLRCSENPQAER